MTNYFRLDELTGEAYVEAVKAVIRAPFTNFTLSDLANPNYKAIEDLARAVGCKFDANGNMTVKEVR